MPKVTDQDIPPEYYDLYTSWFEEARALGEVRRIHPITLTRLATPAQLAWRAFFRTGSQCFAALDGAARALWYQHQQDYFPALYYYNVFMMCWLLGPYNGGSGACPPNYCLPPLASFGCYSWDVGWWQYFGLGMFWHGQDLPCLAQRFQTATPGSLRTLKVYLRRSTTADLGAVTVSLRPSRDGDVLASTDIPSADMPTGTGIPTTIDLYYCCLEADTDYYLQICADPNLVQGGNYRLGGVSFRDCAPGELWKKVNGVWVYTDATGDDDAWWQANEDY